MLGACQQQGRNAIKINFDEKNPFKIDARNLAPIYAGSAHVECPYCHAVYQPGDRNSLCDVCDLATVGNDTVGLVVSTVRTRRG